MNTYLSEDLLNQNNNQNNRNIIDNLEEFQLTEEIIKKAEIKECRICLEEFTINDKACYLPCFHLFHSSCIKNWFKNSKKCPLCNVEVKFD